MSDKKKWKNRLLSSSLPIEFDVAKILAKNNCHIKYDYTYLRTDSNNIRKEFSTDILATKYLSNSDNSIYSTVDYLIECKHREESKKWVFLPEINTEFSNITLGNTIRYLKEFSVTNIQMEKIYEFEKHFEYGFKGFEINIQTGEVFDKDINHGINQLKYALSNLIIGKINNAIYRHIDDIRPAFIIPILVTNSELYLLNENFGIETVKNSNEIGDLGTKVPYLVQYNNIGPDLRRHNAIEFKDFNLLPDEKNNIVYIDSIRKKWKDEKFGFYNSPIKKCIDYSESEYLTMESSYSQFIVCSLENLESLTKKINNLIIELTKPTTNKVYN